MKKYFIIVILSGLFMRLIWNNDMEWKADEKQMYAMAHETIDKSVFPAVGMESSGGIVNPGMSVGVFAVIALFTNDPISMDRAVQIINIIALLCFVFFALKKIDPSEKEIWLTGIALASVSPLAVIFSRKIWAQDLLPIFSFLIIFTNYYRNKKWGAFFWGLAGALIGQVHMSGFFFALGIFIITLIHDHYNKIKLHWLPWLAGSLIGSVSLIPWISYLIQHPQASKISFMHILQFNFYIYWFIDSLGLDTYYSLRKDFWIFLREPVIMSIPTYMVAVIHIFFVFIGIILLNKILKYFVNIYHLLKQNISLKIFFTGMSLTKFYLLGIFLGLGVFMTLSGTPIYQHYLICAFPFSYIFLAKMLQPHKKIIYALIITQLVLSLTFLFFIHKNNGAQQGDYGKTYHAQSTTEKNL